MMAFLLQFDLPVIEWSVPLRLGISVDLFPQQPVSLRTSVSAASDGSAPGENTPQSDEVRGGLCV